MADYDAPASSRAAAAEYDTLIKWVVDRLEGLGFPQTSWSADEDSHVSVIDFVTGEGPKTLSVVKSEDNAANYKIFCDDTGHDVKVKGLVAYFLRASVSTLDIDNMSKEVQFGTVGGKGLNLASFERVMKGLVERTVSRNEALTEGARNELTGHFHRCMATLTDSIHYSDGRTVLYCPSFEYKSVQDAAMGKELIQIMESVVIHWTRQIKDVVNNLDNSSSAETSGPLAEIEFWKTRAQDLIGIQEQLQGVNVQRIVDVLQYAKSNYIGPFYALTKQIVTRASEANDNLKFLESIREHCVHLREIEASKVVTVLPDLLARIRLIWSYSAFYNNQERIQGLLRKVSNEIITRFRNHVPIADILDGDVEFCMDRLHESIDCGVQWKAIYTKTQAAIARSKKQGAGWEMDGASIFAQIDAFVQRCRDLLELCESQMQFCRKSAATNGHRGPMPQFGGTKAREIIAGIEDIEKSFELEVDRLRALDYDMLDVRVSRWHDDYHHFKSAVKDLEIMFTNVINSAFESNITVQEGCNLLAIFHTLAKRETVRACTTRKANEMHLMFLENVKASRTEFDSGRQNPPLRPHEPQFAGSALWAHSLCAKVKDNFEVLSKKLKPVLSAKLLEEATHAEQSFVKIIKDFKDSRYKQWNEDFIEKSRDNGLYGRLEKPILARVELHDSAQSAVGGAARQFTEIVCNFDQDLITLFTEVIYWEKFHGEFSIPYGAHDLCNKKEQLRIMRENVSHIVRAYNDIIRDITAEERRLFIDHLRKLDRRVNQGLTKLTWQSKNMIDMYVRDCVASCQDTHSIVKEFKESKNTVYRICKQMASVLLLKVEKNVLYEEGMFEQRQAEHRAMISSQFEAGFNKIMSLLRHIYKNFREGSSEVLREWRSQITHIDKMMEQSLKHCVKRSLQELSKCINGDAKTDPQTIFTVKIDLIHTKVTYDPSMISLTHNVNIVAKAIIEVVIAVPRIRGQTFDESKKESVLGAAAVAASAAAATAGTAVAVDPVTGEAQAQVGAVVNEAEAEKYKKYYDVISDDTDILRIVVQVMNGMSSTATELQKYLSYWDKYKALWEMDKEFFVRRYAKANRTPAQFDDDISRYKLQQAEIQGEEVSHPVNFVFVNCNQMKDKLVRHCMECQNKLTGLLNQNGAAELNEIFELFRKSRENLSVSPINLVELSSKLATAKELREQCASIRARFDPVREIYATLKKFEVQEKEEEKERLETMDTAYEEFVVMLGDSDKVLDKSKVTMKRDLESQLDVFGQNMVEMKNQSVELPRDNPQFAPEKALALIEQYKQKIEKQKIREGELNQGLAIFAIAPNENKDLVAIEKELDLLSQIWAVTIEWNTAWDSWKNGQFKDLDVEEMENTAGGFAKRVGKLGRDIKKWKVWASMKAELDKFRETIPLIQDLRNKALRQRHWTWLQERIGQEFDPTSAEFTLAEVVKLGLNAHSEYIGELSSNANKELAIETALTEVERRWADVQLDMGPYKERYFKLKSTEDISQFLEDDSVALSTMKASKFYGSFQAKIDSWEHTLSLISEVVESVLSVQRKWIYLESIFMSGGDIAKQLPHEHALFVGVNNDFFRTMDGFNKNPNAKIACTAPGLLVSVNGMDEGLEKIQKSLDQYLETKRQVFPRFYFVSDDDLLEILGQSKDPMAVQKHIKKCFEGVKGLKMIPPGGAIKTFEAQWMIAPDGEVANFVENVVIDGAVELWLLLVEKAMQRGMSKLLSISIQGFKGKKEKWVKDTQGQLLITTGSIVWTIDCNRSLMAIASGSKGALKQQKKKQVSYLGKLTTMIRSPLSKIDRNKVVALITMEIHSRDVIERMIKANCAAVTDFEWLSQLRFIYVKDGAEFGKCEVRQTNSVLEYSYEYQGNNGRLVVTPLTDRCVLTLITAMYLNRGGNPLGPAGTGKTETVKDLGKNLAKYVVVINCSDGMDYKSVGRIFSGLVQSGSWGCFDEFNRIKIEVISVVAMQILSILNAMSAKLTSFPFMGVNIPCNSSCGIFITMNPGYAGRTELPDNLKAIMRPVCMMQPDLTMIAEVMLASEGFNEARIMAKKTVTLYSLMIQQLSKQFHYDYGLRNLKAVLNMAGQLKRSDPNMIEEVILMRALRDMNLPKFIKDDERLFRLLLGDLFPSLELPASEFGALQVTIEAELEKALLQNQDFLLAKIFQFYDSRATRHCNMLVGDPLGGKSTAWKILAAAQTSLCKQGVEGFQSVTPYIISPKAIELDELYGAYDLATFEWKDGVLATMFKACSEDEKPNEKWILFDGPIDALWIESMNSVMDDNRILTLINGDRIPLTNSMSLVFETQNLAVASPATVSRAGMIYIDALELPYQVYVDSWLQAKYSKDEELKQLLKDFIDKYVSKVLKFKELNCNEPVKNSDFARVSQLCNLFDALMAAETSFKKETLGADYAAVAEKLFLFAMAWSIGGGVDDAGRKKFTTCLSDIDPSAPVSGTIYDFYVDIQKNDYVLWETKVPQFRTTKNMTFYDMIVPTVDTVRNMYVVDILTKIKKNVMIVGETGTGKTVLVQGLLRDLPHTTSQLVINFSAATTSAMTQDIIEAPMEKRSKDKLGPLGGKNLMIFIDDFNMPKKTSLESPFQPPVELIRMYMDYGGWYDRAKCSWKFIVDCQLVVSMGHPGGGRNQICERTQSRFALMNFTFPSDSQIIRIFESILSINFAEYDPEIKQMASSFAIATLNVYKGVVADFLATPEKFHYLFNIRDVAKVIQGMMMATRATVYTPESMLRLWAHECQRVMSDRFIRSAGKISDEQKFIEILRVKMNESFQKDWDNIMVDALDRKSGAVFCAFMQEGGDDIIYEEVTDYQKVRTLVEEKLEDYNMEPKLIAMDLAMFRDAILHVARIHRVLMQPRGNMMLVGVGGSGRSSLCRLSSYMANMTVFTIEITKNYRLIEFREDIKKLYMTAGAENKKVVFLFNDTQIKDEGFLEDVNNILSSGLVPNLFGKEDLPGILDAVRKPAVQHGLEDAQDVLWSFFIERVRGNLHVVLAMSPVGDSLRNRCRMYPGLVNCTTIDWFHTWPADALQEVAMKFLSTVEFSEEDARGKIACVFADMHLSVISSSERMKSELKRFNYVTPTNYLELVKGYRSLLAEKQASLSSSAGKLANGLAKLEDAREQVETLSKELAVKKVVVAQSQKDCEDLLVEIVGEKRVADEQKKRVEADSERIEKEAAECKAISDDAEADLAVAMPALEAAMEEVDKLDKSAVSEVKAYTKPPPPVETVMQAVMILFGRATDWATAKKCLGEANFLSSVKNFDKDHVSAGANNKIKKYIENPDFAVPKIKAVSAAAGALCCWVHAIYVYSNVAKEIAPKRLRLKEASESLAIKQAALAEAQEALAVVLAKLAKLQVSYDTSVGEKNSLKEEAQMLETKLDRADKLVKGLAGEYTRWQSSIGEFNSALVRVVGDALLAAAFLSYAGPFETSYRNALMHIWVGSVKTQKLHVTDPFDFTVFLAKPTDVRDWNIQGLPKDDFSTENGVISTRTRRWPLMIDPQGQANKWVRNMEGANLRIIDLKMQGYLREVENAVQYGFPVLLQDILEEIDPALEPVLSKSVLKIGNREVMRIGDKELDFSPDFKLYITTKLANPHYTPEISTKATVVNFAVKKDGLEAQLLGIVVQKEEPNLEKQKSELTIRVAAGKRQLVDLEDEILRLLSESTGSLLDDEGLVNTLQQSKITSEEVTAGLIVAEDTEKKIDAARMGYRTAAVRASLAYFVLDDMGRVDPMYQFSLDAYVDLFNNSIDSSRTPAGETGVKRCEDINATHTLAVYNYTCRGLFEEHKLLFAFQLCIRIMEVNGGINQEEFNYFCIGVGLVDRTAQRNNPCSDWVSPIMWDNISEMDKLPGFQGIVSSFEQMHREWKAWYLSHKPEEEHMPGDWSNKCSELQKLCIVRAVRLDRALFAVAKFISANIGPEFVDPPAFDLKAVYETSNCKTPLIFVLSPGVDPMSGIIQLSSLLGQRVENCALGQGQAPVAVRMIESGVENGSWVFLANCHLMLSWMPTLEKMIESLVEGNPHPKFRLWLSSSPNPEFPITILQRGIKMTTEPPSGLRANLSTLYNTISDEQFARCNHQSAYKRLLFSLVWFHAILLERRKFKSLGFNIPYDFNESDFAICHDLIIVFLDEYPDRVPFEAMKYLIAEANYGGRVTDDFDRKLVNVYINELFCDNCVQQEKFQLAMDVPEYYIPEDGDLKSYKDHIRSFPATDQPSAFGQHLNADISSQIDDANTLISTLVSLQPRTVKAESEDGEDPLAIQCADLLEQAPEVFNLRTIRQNMEHRADPDPLKTVMYQELDRYNELLTRVRSNLINIGKALQGLASVTSELEDVMDAVGRFAVPRGWGKTYPSIKTLGNWMKDLVARCEMFSVWTETELPRQFWLPAFTYPSGFLTAVLQTSARANGVAIDALSWEFPVLQHAEVNQITSHPKEGVYVSGIFVEGACWNFAGGFLEDPRPMELIARMPIIHFKPVEGKRKVIKGMYNCPIYMFPVRTGTRERPSFVITADLRGGRWNSDYWCKRGVALLLSCA